MPPESIERHIIIERCKLDGYDIPEKVLNDLMKIAVDLREMSDQGTFPGTWGIREQIKVARKTRWYKNLTTAYKRASLDLYERETAALAIKAIETIVDPSSNKWTGVNDQPF